MVGRSLEEAIVTLGDGPAEDWLVLRRRKQSGLRQKHGKGSGNGAVQTPGTGEDLMGMWTRGARGNVKWESSGFPVSRLDLSKSRHTLTPFRKVVSNPRMGNSSFRSTPELRSRTPP